ncbi:hypothetical protein [Bacillus sp. V5-8f]|uniref:hypothetical protein n=1 Tax=Bacillus sp. V5-8f TaxID=2053044 RepID=UPI0011587984|nr:hypothetical protein [Bacillus sp. V5-8f]
MEVAEKKVLREQKLQELYDHNEKNGGREATIRYNNLRENEGEKQEHLAYEYLADKELVNYKIFGKNYCRAKITSRGIDEIESK